MQKNNHFFYFLCAPLCLFFFHANVIQAGEEVDQEIRQAFSLHGITLSSADVYTKEEVADISDWYQRLGDDEKKNIPLQRAGAKSIDFKPNDDTPEDSRRSAMTSIRDQMQTHYPGKMFPEQTAHRGLPESIAFFPEAANRLRSIDDDLFGFNSTAGRPRGGPTQPPARTPRASGAPEPTGPRATRAIDADQTPVASHRTFVVGEPAPSSTLVAAPTPLPGSGPTATAEALREPQPAAVSPASTSEGPAGDRTGLSAKEIAAETRAAEDAATLQRGIKEYEKRKLRGLLLASDTVLAQAAPPRDHARDEVDDILDELEAGLGSPKAGRATPKPTGEDDWIYSNLGTEPLLHPLAPPPAPSDAETPQSRRLPLTPAPAAKAPQPPRSPTPGRTLREDHADAESTVVFSGRAVGGEAGGPDSGTDRPTVTGFLERIKLGASRSAGVPAGPATSSPSPQTDFRRQGGIGSQAPGRTLAVTSSSTGARSMFLGSSAPVIGEDGYESPEGSAREAPGLVSATKGINLTSRQTGSIDSSWARTKRGVTRKDGAVPSLPSDVEASGEDVGAAGTSTSSTISTRGLPAPTDTRITPPAPPPPVGRSVDLVTGTPTSRGPQPPTLPQGSIVPKGLSSALTQSAGDSPTPARPLAPSTLPSSTPPQDLRPLTPLTSGADSTAPASPVTTPSTTGSPTSDTDLSEGEVGLSPSQKPVGKAGFAPGTVNPDQDIRTQDPVPQDLQKSVQTGFKPRTDRSADGTPGPQATPANPLLLLTFAGSGKMDYVSTNPFVSPPSPTGSQVSASSLGSTSSGKVPAGSRKKASPKALGVSTSKDDGTHSPRSDVELSPLSAGSGTPGSRSPGEIRDGDSPLTGTTGASSLSPKETKRRGGSKFTFDADDIALSDKKKTAGARSPGQATPPPSTPGSLSGDDNYDYGDFNVEIPRKGVPQPSAQSTTDGPRTRSTDRWAVGGGLHLWQHSATTPFATRWTSPSPVPNARTSFTKARSPLQSPRPSRTLSPASEATLNARLPKVNAGLVAGKRLFAQRRKPSTSPSSSVESTPPASPLTSPASSPRREGARDEPQSGPGSTGPQGKKRFLDDLPALPGARNPRGDLWDYTDPTLQSYDPAAVVSTGKTFRRRASSLEDTPPASPTSGVVPPLLSIKGTRSTPGTAVSPLEAAGGDALTSLTSMVGGPKQPLVSAARSQSRDADEETPRPPLTRALAKPPFPPSESATSSVVLPGASGPLPATPPPSPSVHEEPTASGSAETDADGAPLSAGSTVVRRKPADVKMVIVGSPQDRDTVDARPVDDRAGGTLVGRGGPPTSLPRSSSGPSTTFRPFGAPPPPLAKVATETAADGRDPLGGPSGTSSDLKARRGSGDSSPSFFAGGSPPLLRSGDASARSSLSFGSEDSSLGSPKLPQTPNATIKSGRRAKNPSTELAARKFKGARVQPQPVSPRTPVTPVRTVDGEKAALAARRRDIASASRGVHNKYGTSFISPETRRDKPLRERRDSDAPPRTSSAASLVGRVPPLKGGPFSKPSTVLSTSTTPAGGEPGSPTATSTPLRDGKSKPGGERDDRESVVVVSEGSGGPAPRSPFVEVPPGAKSRVDGARPQPGRAPARLQTFTTARRGSIASTLTFGSGSTDSLPEGRRSSPREMARIIPRERVRGVFAAQSKPEEPSAPAGWMITHRAPVNRRQKRTREQRQRIREIREEDADESEKTSLQVHINAVAKKLADNDEALDATAEQHGTRPEDVVHTYSRREVLVDQLKALQGLYARKFGQDDFIANSQAFTGQHEAKIEIARTRATKERLGLGTKKLGEVAARKIEQKRTFKEHSNDSASAPPVAHRAQPARPARAG